MTGTIPFHDVAMDITVIKRVIRGDLPLIAKDVRVSVNLALCSLMAKCWSIDPTKRPTAEDCRKSISWMVSIICLGVCVLNLSAIDTLLTCPLYSQ